MIGIKDFNARYLISYFFILLNILNIFYAKLTSKTSVKMIFSLNTKHGKIVLNSENGTNL